MKKQIILLLLFIFNFSFSQDIEWEFLGKTNEVRNYISKNIDFGQKQFWELSYKNIIDKDIDHTVNLIEFDCDKSRLKLHLSIYYDKEGKVINSIRFSEEVKRWIETPPDSILSYELKKVCSKIK